MKGGPFNDDAVVSACFQSMFEMVTEWDFFLQDINVLGDTLKFYDFFVYYPSRILKETENAYE